MNAENQFEAYSVITTNGIQRAVSDNSLVNPQRSADSSKADCIGGWQNIACDDAIARAYFDTVNDPLEVQVARRRLRITIGSTVLEALSRRQLTDPDFDRITCRDKDYWKKWLNFQLRNDRLELKDGVYCPGPQWAIMVVSMQ